MRWSLLLLCFFWLSQPCLRATGYFAFTPTAERIYDAILELRLTEAQSMIAHWKINQPDNLLVHHLENYVDFFVVFVSEDEALYDRLLKRRDQRIERLQEGDPDSPYYLYTQAEIRLHWALLKFRFEDYFSAFRDINQAHKLLLENADRFPDFLGNQKDLGILHAAVGTVPDNFRWGLEMLTSLEGSVEQGKREVANVLAQAQTRAFPYALETQVIYTFLLLHLDGRPAAAWEALQAADLKQEASPLHAFVKANVAMRTGRNEQAIIWISAAPRGDAFFPFPYLDYMLGVCKLRRLDTFASTHLSTFIRATQGRHYIKEAYQKLAWCELLRNNTNGYRNYMQQVLTKGTNAAGGDKNAEREAQAGIIPALSLLQARLLYDGGYYQRASDLLNQYSLSSYSTELQQLEYTYRLGRILQGLTNYDQAINSYEQTIEQGFNNGAFYACNAALQIGLIEEQRGNREAARTAFRQCLQMRPDEYRTGLHQQAKAGLSRVN